MRWQPYTRAGCARSQIDSWALAANGRASMPAHRAMLEDKRMKTGQSKHRRKRENRLLRGDPRRTVMELYRLWRAGHGELDRPNASGAPLWERRLSALLQSELADQRSQLKHMAPRSTRTCGATNRHAWRRALDWLAQVVREAGRIAQEAPSAMPEGAQSAPAHELPVHFWADLYAFAADHGLHLPLHVHSVATMGSPKSGVFRGRALSKSEQAIRFIKH